MIIFVDYEHPDRYADPKAQRIQAARTWITYRLEDLAGMHCMLVRYDRITEALLTTLGARAIFISGNATEPSRYRPADLEPLHTIIATTTLPVFGFCGGFQCMAAALGAPVISLDLGADTVETEMVKRFPTGAFGEVGYHPIQLVADHPLLANLGDAPVFRHAHGLHVPDPPVGFAPIARTDVTPVQMAVDDERRMVGTQFHPEYWTDQHPAGQQLIANFFRWAGLR